MICQLTKVRMKLRDVSLPFLLLARLFIRETWSFIEMNKESQPDACQVVTQAPPLVTTCNVNRANLRCTLGNTLHVRGGRGSGYKRS